MSSPWPGLAAYEEKDRVFFVGRDAETAVLLAAVRRAPLTVLFGQSGLGKTSLLQAGLFPSLRGDGGFPVTIRLSFDPKAPPLTEQVLKKIGEAAENTRQLYPDQPELHVSPPASKGGAHRRLTLWEFFHRSDGYFWGGRNRLATPVLVLDQFEEWFTHGAGLPLDQRHAFLTELHQLLDNDPPAHCDPAEGWNLERVPLSMVISLREDYLAHLGELREFLPGLRESELRLLPFSAAQAREVIEKPAPWPADNALTDAALDSLHQSAREPVAIAVSLGAETDYDPAILSLLLSRLFDSLLHAETGEARARIVRDKGQDVLLDFYHEALTGAGANSRERNFVEEQLVTHSGLRNSIALDDAESRYRVRRSVLDRLRDARLLHFDDRSMGHQRVELAHDVLCQVALRARDKRRALARKGLVAATSVALIVMGFAGFQAWNEARARNARDAEIHAVLEQVDIADRAIERREFQQARDALERARTKLRDAPDQKYLLRAIARTTHSLGTKYEREGNSARSALDAFTQARSDYERIAKINPDDDQAQADLAIETSSVADQLKAVGDSEHALQAYVINKDNFEKLATKDPDNPKWQRGLADSYLVLGNFFIEQGNFAGALQVFREYNKMSQKLAAKDSNWQRDFAVSHDCLGDVLEGQGDLMDALEAFQRGNEIFKELVAKDPDNDQWQTDLAENHERLGTVVEAQGDLTGALKEFRTAYDIRQKLATTDPENASWQSDLTYTQGKIGDVLEAQGDLAGALKEIHIAYAIRQKLATTDPENAGWQRDFADSHSKIGDVLEAQGDLTGALKEFRSAYDIRKKLAAKDPENTDWQANLADSHGKIGNVLEAQGDLTGALNEYRIDNNIRQKLAAKNPDNPAWQSTLAPSHRQIGDAETKLDDLPAAEASYRIALERMTPLSSRAEAPVLWRWEMARIRVNLGHALCLSGQPESALVELQEAEKEMQAAATASPENVQYLGGQALVELRFGQALLGVHPPKTEEGLSRLKAGRDRLLGLKNRHELNFYQEQWLTELNQEVDKVSAR